MPAKGYHLISVSDKIYNLAKQKLNEQHEKFEKIRVKSVSDFFEEAVLMYFQLLEADLITFSDSMEPKGKLKGK